MNENNRTADTAAPSAAPLPAVEIFTDGGCAPNPGPGGWGIVLKDATKTKELIGGEADSTNNRCELMAAIVGLEALLRPCAVTVWTDSEYVRKGITEWLTKWKANDWRKSDRKPVLNRDLWERLEAAAARHRVDWKWIRGHAGHPENGRADALVAIGRQRLMR